ncbi:MAG TPA: two-component regulator propeller domain-containing protein [Bryobacteraceae bacterium]|nr:two-component regulator propeller domain-containing protein [Bryobacteraceae bacterium]
MIVLRRFTVAILILITSSHAWAQDEVRIAIVKGSDVRFRKLSNPHNLSQVRVNQIVQDAQGFMWFGTWNGLNRYDGYKFKVFKHEPGNPHSLSGVFVYSLFKDRSGTLWIGTDQFLDRFDPRTETFRHYRLDDPAAKGLATTVNHISQDSLGMLWLSTRNGLFRLNPESGDLTSYRHEPADPSSIGDNDVKTTGEDRSGAFWVGTSQTLDEFDRATGKVKRHVHIGESGVGLFFHEDRRGTFWVISNSFGKISTLDRRTNRLTTFEYEWKTGDPRSNQAYAMLEDRDGNMWFGTAGAGLMKYDHKNNVFVSYAHDPADPDTIGDTRVWALYEDREGNVWTGLHQVEPNFFRKEPLPFENLNRKLRAPDERASGLVSTVYQDRGGALWVGVNRQLKRIDRKTGAISRLEETANTDVLSIVEEGPEVLWLGNARPGLLRLNLRTGERKGYRHDRSDPTTLCSGIIHRLLIDRHGTLWAATWDGLCRFDATTEKFTTYKPDPGARGLNYYTIAEARDGALWLGGNLGLHRFDPRTKTFTLYKHDADDPASISDNRVSSVFFDHTGTLWVGTQNGLDRFDAQKNTFKGYDQRQGMAGNAVSCILEDSRGVLWMSTNKGVSSFNPRTERFANYTAADGLPGPDLTGWGACHKSPTGEMFFGGFNGATAFFPDKVSETTYVPPTVLTEFRLFGTAVNAGSQSALRHAINHTNSITLSHKQNIFSVEFSALTYLNPATNRYRYKLDGLEEAWNEVGGDERVATYTTLPAGSYTFRLQAATSRGPWSPEVTLGVTIEPPFWRTTWFETLCVIVFSAVIWGLYNARVKRVAAHFNLRLEERVGERTRIAQELHDTLLQNITGLCLQISGLAKVVNDPIWVKERLLDLRKQTEDCIREARQSVWDIRSPEPATIDLATEIEQSGRQFAAGTSTRFRFVLTGEPRPLQPDIRQQLLRIGHEALGNAAQHAQASCMEACLTFETTGVRLRISDDGRGFDADAARHIPGHFGMATMQERAARIRASITITSEPGAGTRVEIFVPTAKGANEWKEHSRYASSS